MTKPLTLNNLSRVCFAQFLSNNQQKVERVDSRNVCRMDNKIYAFSTVDKPVIECRQLYSDCSGLICYNITTDKLYVVAREDLKVDSKPNRITTSGISAYSAKTELLTKYESTLKL